MVNYEFGEIDAFNFFRKKIMNNIKINKIYLDWFINVKKRPISAVADNYEFRNAKKIIVKTNNKIKFKLLYDNNRSLQKKIKIEQLRRETS